MAQVRIEMDRGMGWEVRQEGEVAVTAEALVGMLPAYCVQYPHRALLDGVVVGECKPSKRRRA